MKLSEFISQLQNRDDLPMVSGHIRYMSVECTLLNGKCGYKISSLSTIGQRLGSICRAKG